MNKNVLPGQPLLELRNLSAGYADDPVVMDVTLTIKAGTISTIIGGNGAGKSTLLKAIYGANKHFGGSLHFVGESIESLPSVERVKRGIDFVPQGRCNFPIMAATLSLSVALAPGNRRQLHPGVVPSLSCLAHRQWLTGIEHRQICNPCWVRRMPSKARC